MVVNWAVSEIDLPDAGFGGLPTAARDAAFGGPRAGQAWIIGQGLIAYGRDDPECVPGVLEGPGRGALAGLDAAQQLAGYAQELSRGKRTFLGDDLVSVLAAGELGGQPLTPEQLAQWFILLLIAGTETTRQAITHGALLLGRHPGQRTAWQQDFARPAPAAAGDLVRWSSPVISVRRTPARDLEVTGDPQWLRSSAIYGIRHLPVRFTPSRPGG